MAGHRIPSQATGNPISAHTYPHLALHQLHGQNPQVAGDYQEGVHREGVPSPVGNVVVPGEMQHPPHIDAPNYDYNGAYYHPPPPPAPQAPYVHMYWDDRVAEPVPAQAHPLAPHVQENHDGYGPHFAPADPPEAFPGVRPHPAPPADIPPAANGLRNLAGHFLNNPGTLVNMLRIVPGPNGRLEVWIALELADIHIF